MAAKNKSIKYIVLAAIALAVGLLYLNLGSLITQTAEKIASGALGVKVDIGSIHVSLSDKKVEVDKVEIGNPSGYKTPYAIKAEKINIGLNTASDKLIDFKDIQVLGSAVNLEVNEKGMNLADLKKLAAGKEQKESVGSKQVQVIVQHMVIGASVIHPSITMLDKEIAPINMPPLTFSGIGKDGNTDASEAIVQVMTKYISAIESIARKNGALGGLPGSVDDVKKALDGAAEGLQQLLR